MTFSLGFATFALVVVVILHVYTVRTWRKIHRLYARYDRSYDPKKLRR